MIQVQVNIQQRVLPLDEQWLRQIVTVVLSGEGAASASVSVAVLDDKAIHELNRRYLHHDYPTDVLSFVLEEGDQGLEGEVIVSAETAAREAAGFGWSAADELALYVVHGTLHLLGYDDHEDSDIAAMRAKERHYLARMGIGRPAERF